MLEQYYTTMEEVNKTFCRPKIFVERLVEVNEPQRVLFTTMGEVNKTFCRPREFIVVLVETED